MLLSTTPVVWFTPAMFIFEKNLIDGGTDGYLSPQTTLSSYNLSLGPMMEQFQFVKVLSHAEIKYLTYDLQVHKKRMCPHPFRTLQVV